MKFLFYTSEKPQEQLLEIALRNSGLDISFTTNTSEIPDADIYCFVGVKRGDLIRRLGAAGKPWLYFDKAYNRDWPRWWRVAFCEQQPTKYLMNISRSEDRAAAQGWLTRMKLWRERGKHILYCGSSAKCHDFLGHEEADPTAYAAQVIAEIRKLTRRRIVYRPKPSWKAAVPVPGADFSARGKAGDIYAALRGAYCLITHTSSTCFDALLVGVPSIVLGDGVTRPISSTSLDDVERPKLASESECRQLLSNLAYCQWNLDEIRSGRANGYLREIVQV